MNCPNCKKNLPLSTALHLLEEQVICPSCKTTFPLKKLLPPKKAKGLDRYFQLNSIPDQTTLSYQENQIILQAAYFTWYSFLLYLIGTILLLSGTVSYVYTQTSSGHISEGSTLLIIFLVGLSLLSTYLLFVQLLGSIELRFDATHLIVKDKITFPKCSTEQVFVINQLTTIESKTLVGYKGFTTTFMLINQKKQNKSITTEIMVEMPPERVQYLVQAANRIIVYSKHSSILTIPFNSPPTTSSLKGLNNN
jgi:hypothetical protein